MSSFIKENKWLIILPALAVLVRLIYLFELSRFEDFAILMVDEKWHWLWAQEIVEKSFWGMGSYFRAPLYPYFLAFLYFITNGSILVSKILQILLCGGTAYFLYRLTDHLFGKKSAIIAGFIYAFYGILIFYEAIFLIPVLFLFFTVWGIYRFIIYSQSTSSLSWIITGLIFGLAAIARPNILLVIPFLLLWLFYKYKKDDIAKAIKLPAIFLLGAVLVVAPVTIRNLAVTGEFVLISTQGGINLYLGNNSTADGLTMMMPEIDLDESSTWSEFTSSTKRAAEIESGHSLTEGEASAFWTSKALDYIYNNPEGFLHLCWKKTVFLLSGFENSDNADIYYQRTKSNLYSILVWKDFLKFPFGLLLPLFIAGIYIRRDDMKKLMPLYIFLLAYVPTIIFFLVTARHRLPLVIVMIPIAAAGISGISQQLKRINIKKLSTILLLIVAPLIIFNQTYYDQELVGGEFQIHFNNGIKFEQLNNYEKAETEYILANNFFNGSPTLLNNLGYVQTRLDKYEKAHKSFSNAIALDSNFTPAYNNMGLLMKRTGDYDSAVTLFNTAIDKYQPENAKPHDLSQFYLNLAETFEANEVIDDATINYMKAIEVDSGFIPAYTKAASFNARHQVFFISDSLFARALKLGEIDAGDYFNWGLSFIQRQLYSSGIDKLYLAVEKDPNMFQAHYLIAAGYYENAFPKDSINKYLNNCLRLSPGYQPALMLRSKVAQQN